MELFLAAATAWPDAVMAIAGMICMVAVVWLVTR